MAVDEQLMAADEQQSSQAAAAKQYLLFTISPPEYLVGTDSQLMLSNCGFAVINWYDFLTRDTPSSFSPGQAFPLSKAYSSLLNAFYLRLEKKDSSFITVL